MTAETLAQRLEVSVRTVLRDVEALGEAGVPIFTTQGTNGGIELMHGFETHLTGLTPDEAACLFLVGQPLVAHRLGLGAPARTARTKLLNALPHALGEEADRLASWFLNDPDPATGNRIPHGELRRISRSILQHREVELTMGHGETSTVRPLGLVLRAGSWHLVSFDKGSGQGKSSTRVICLDDLRATRLTTRAFTPPRDFDLHAAWLHGRSSR